jgi:cupin fold WbuC family metalloprotein
MREIFYDDDGSMTDSFLLTPNGCCMGLNIPRGQWHTVEVLEPSVILESKDGAYEPISESDILNI